MAQEKDVRFVRNPSEKALRVVILRSNPIAPDPRVEKIARSLSRAGYKVTVVGWDRLAVYPKLEERDYAKVYRLHIRARFGSGLRNLPYLLKWQLGLCQWLIKNHSNYQIIHACDFDTVLPAVLAKVVLKKRVVYDIFDFYADRLRKTPEWIKRIIRRVDLWVIGFVDAVIIADDIRHEQIQGARPKRIEVIYNSPEPIELLKADTEINKKGKLHIAYVGLLQVERGLLELIELLKRHPEWHLDLAGFGGDEKIILREAEKLSNVTFYGRVSYEKALKISAKADVLVATYDPKIPNHRYSSPNKLFEAMMLGKPIIVARGTGMDRLVEKYRLGLVIEYGNVSQLEKVLKEITSWNEKTREAFATRVRNIFFQEFSWQLMEKRLINIYARITGKEVFLCCAF